MSLANPTVIIPADFPPQISGSDHLDRLRQRAEVELHSDRPDDPQELVRRVRRGNILMNSRGSVHWSAEMLEQLPELRMITTVSIGTDAIDLAAAARQNITVCNIPDQTISIVAEHALALLLAAAKRLAFQTAEMQAGRWTRRRNVLLAGKTLGIVGAGPIGAATAQLARAIGMNVIAWTFHPSPERAAKLGVRFVELEELLRTSDAVSVHVRMSEQSRLLLGRQELSWMKPGALLINTARGAIVDNQAVRELLDQGHLGGAATDVYETEPPPPEHPLLHCEQVVLTPHSADCTPEGMDRLNAAAVDNILAFLDGAPRNQIA